MVGSERGQGEGGTKGVAGVEGCLVEKVGREGVADQGRGRVVRETCVQVDVMGSVGV